MAQGYERAARLSPESHARARRLVRAAAAGWSLGLDRVERLCREALELAQDAQLRGEIHAELETALYWRGDLPAAHRVKIETADELAATAPVQSAHMRARATASLRHFLRGEEAIAVGRQAFELISEIDGSDPRVPLMYAQALVRAGTVEEGAKIAQRSAEVDTETADASLQANLAEIRILQDDLDAAQALLDAWLRPARQTGNVSELANGLEHRASCLAQRGDLVTAHAAALEAAELAELLPDEVLQRAEAAVRVCVVSALRGDAAAAQNAAGTALELARRCHSRFLEAQVSAALGTLALSRGDADAAITHLEAVRDLVRGGGYRHPAFVQFSPELVEAYVRAGRDEDASTELALLEADSLLAGSPWALAAASRCRGLAHGDLTAFEEALAHHRKSPRALERARTQLAYGERLRRDGERVRAREQLKAALEAFESSGAAAWAERARDELRATGEHIRSDDRAREELTPQELQVALVVTEGATNKEAASRLFLSPKTIEFHLRNAYRKLGVRSRTELANALRGGG